MTHRNLINELKNVDFSTDNRDFILDRLKKLEKFGVIITTLHKGKKNIRARISEKESYKEISQLSFKPQEYNLTYQRASTPKQTMFLEFSRKTQTKSRGHIPDIVLRQNIVIELARDVA